MNCGDSVSRIQVDAIFKMVREPGVREFLLDVNPAQDLYMLTQPMQRFHSISGEHEFTLTKHTVAPGEPRNLSRWLLMPALNFGSRAAGLFIQHRDDGMHFVRFVRNDDTGEVLYITDIPGTRCTEVMLATQTSAKARRSAYLRFGTTEFRQAFDGPHSDAAVSVLSDALVTSCIITEARACPYCGTPPAARCACHLSFTRANHCLDFRYYGANSSNMFGSYRGRMMLSTYRFGQERSCQQFDVESATQCAPRGVTDQLLQWAVQSRSALTPAALAVPSGLLAQAAAASDGGGGRGGGGSSGGGTDSGSAGSRRERSASPQAVDFDAHRRPVYDDAESIEPADGGLRDLFCSLVDHLLENGGDGHASPADVGSPSMDDLAPPDLMSFGVVQLNGMVPAAQPLAPAVRQQERASGALLLPRRGAEEGTLHRKSAEGNRTQQLLDRKIRKRIAAERSNKKRQEKNRELKEQQKALETQMQKLQERQQELEKENEDLKEQLKERGIPF